MPFWENTKKALVITRWIIVDKVKPFVGETLRQTGQAAVKIYKSPYLRNKATQILNGGRRGLRATLRWWDFTKLLQQNEKSKKLRGLLAGSFRANILYYAGPVLLYAGWIKPIITWLLPRFAATAAFGAINSTVGFLFFSLWVGTMLKNIYYTMSIGIEAEKLIEPRRRVEGCDDSKLEHAKADFDSTICYPRNLITAAVVSRCAPGPVGTLVYAAAYGQNLVEFRFASVGMCTKHRLQLFRENNAYVLAHGLSVLAAATLATEFLCLFTLGIDDPNVSTAVFDFIFQIYMIFSLMNEEALPGKEGKYEPFMLNRLEMVFWKEQANELIDQHVEAKSAHSSVVKRSKIFFRGALVKIGLRAEKKSEEKPGEQQDNLIGFVKGVANYPPLKLLIFLGLTPGLYYPSAFFRNPQVMFSAKIFSPEVLLTIPELAELVKMHSDQIQLGVSVTKWARSTSFLVAYIPSWIVPDKFTNAFTSLGNLDPAFVTQIESLPTLAKRLEAPTQEVEAKMERKLELDEQHVAEPVLATDSPSKVDEGSFVFCGESASFECKEGVDDDWLELDRPAPAEQKDDDWADVVNPLAYAGKPLVATNTAVSASLRDQVSYRLLGTENLFQRKRIHVPEHNAVKTASPRQAQ